MKKVTVSDEEATGIVGYPVTGLYVLMRRERKIIGGELVDEDGSLAVVSAAKRRYYPEADELVVARFDGETFKVVSADLRDSPFMNLSEPKFLTLGRPQSGKSRFFTQHVAEKGGKAID